MMAYFQVQIASLSVKTRQGDHEIRWQRVTSCVAGAQHRLVQQLPNPNTRMLEMLLSHLANIVVKCDKNLMTIAYLGVCFGKDYV